jgi:predicted Zn-dependent protease
LIGSMRRAATIGIAAALALSLCGARAEADSKRTVLLTERDEAVAGRDGAAEARAAIGVYDDPQLAAYVDGIGRTLLRGVPRTFPFQFQIVDQVEANAFALPGGYVFLSRGMLALANSEDELACVMGHEIAHVLRHHAASQQAIARTMSGFTSPWRNAAQLASYSRDMEREADVEGQKLCAAAGYDPRALTTYLQTLRRVEPLLRRVAAGSGFFDTHPSSVERVAAASVNAGELRWRRDPARGDGRAALLAHVDGLPLGPRPEGGVFRGEWFLQPVLNFQVRFPNGWRTTNNNQMVGASEPTGAALVYLTAAPPTADGREGAEKWLAAAQQRGEKIRVVESKPASSGTISTWRLEVEAQDRRGALSSYVTAIPYAAYTYLVVGVTPTFVARTALPATLVPARSFGPLSPEARASIRTTKLAIVTAQKSETPYDVAKRTGGPWGGSEVAIYNGVLDDFRFAAGDRVKVAREQPFGSRVKP